LNELRIGRTVGWKRRAAGWEKREKMRRGREGGKEGTGPLHERE
jgi:hypothetical protein